MKWAIKHKSGRVLFVTSDEFIADNRRKMGWIVEEVKMTSRDQFEGVFEKMKDDRFVSNIDFAWKFWPASRDAIEIELPSWYVCGVDAVFDRDEIEQTIEQAGLKVKK